MAKSARSNRKKKLGTVRREKTLANTEWLKVAENQRQAALLACAAAPKQEVVNEYKHGRGAPKPEEERGRSGADAAAAGGSTSMEVSDELPLGRKAARRAKHSKYGQKPKTGVKVGGKKIGVKVQQFWGKGKKGGAKVHNPKSH
ncbi:MAG: hypothetical protein WDW38_005921 [Sanguina aurantia]